MSVVTIRVPDAAELPMLITKSRRAIEQEAVALKEAVEEYANSPQPGCLFKTDGNAWKQGHHRHRAGRRRLALLGQQQARLMLANALDHLVTMGRALGSDGALSLYSHTTLSRVVCEGVVRLAWLLDATVSYEERIARSAAALLESSESRLQGANAIPADWFGQQPRQVLIERSQTARDKVIRIIDSAGLARVLNRPGTKTASIDVPGTATKIAIKLEIGLLMAKLLPDSPTWYTISSGPAHSVTWTLISAIVTDQSNPNLVLTPDLLEIGSAAETVISASALAIKSYALFYGHDPEPRVTRSQQRRDVLDKLMLGYLHGRKFV